jgi:hypothetical protein
MTTAQTAGTAGLARTGVGLASGEDIEQAGIAGLTSAGIAGVAGGLTDLSASPDLSQGVGGPLSDAQGKLLTPDLGAAGMTPDQVASLGLELPGGDTVFSGAVDGVNQGVDYSGYWDNLAKTNPEMMGIGENIPLHDFTAAQGAPWAEANMAARSPVGDSVSSPTDLSGDTIVPADMNAEAPEAPWTERLGTWYDENVSGPDSTYENFFENPHLKGGDQELTQYTGADTNMMDRPGNLYDKFNTYEGAATNAPGVLLPGAVTAAGLGSMRDANYYEDNLNDYEIAEAKRKAGYDNTVQSIRDSYARAGRALPVGMGGPVFQYAGGGIAGLTRGAGDGTDDRIPAIIDGQQRARLSTDEFVVPADVVSHLGNGSTKAGAETLYSMMDRIRKDRTGKREQPKDINHRNYVPA